MNNTNYTLKDSFAEIYSFRDTTARFTRQTGDTKIRMKMSSKTFLTENKKQYIMLK